MNRLDQLQAKKAWWKHLLKLPIILGALGILFIMLGSFLGFLGFILGILFIFLSGASAEHKYEFFGWFNRVYRLIPFIKGEK